MYDITYNIIVKTLISIKQELFIGNQELRRKGKKKYWRVFDLVIKGMCVEDKCKNTCSFHPMGQQRLSFISIHWPYFL